MFRAMLKLGFGLGPRKLSGEEETPQRGTSEELERKARPAGEPPNKFYSLNSWRKKSHSK